MNPLDIKYKVLIDFDFHANEKLLNTLYLPILGMKPLVIYHYLISKHAYQQQMGAIFQLDFQTLLNSLQLDQTSFEAQLAQLEACELVKTYTDINKQNLIVYHLHEPLKWQVFKQHHYLFNLLKTCISEIDLEKMKYLFENQQELKGLVNVSKNFEHVFTATIPQNINFDALYDFMLKQTNQIIELSPSIKTKINNAYLKWNLSYVEIKHVLAHSLIKQAKLVIVDEHLIDLNLQKTLDVKNISNFNLQLKINRNQQIFLKDANLADFSYVIEDYKSLNSEQYLACIQKHALSELDKNIINGLRENYHLPDFVINILIDFSIFKNAGRVEALYMHKIALTINRLNLTSINAIIKHLQMANQDHQKTKVHKHQQVEW